MFNKGDKITVTNDSIFKIMGLGNVVTGEVFTLDPEGKVIGIRCDQTGCIEGIDDGLIELR